MSGPGNPGWEYCSDIPTVSPQEQCFKLARLQARYTEGLPADLVDQAYGIARARLAGSVALPYELGQLQVLLYDQIGFLGGGWYWVGGGLQFNVPDARNLGVRTQVYSVMGSLEPTPYFTDEEAELVQNTSRRLERACELACLSIDPDLTSITGALDDLKIVQVPLKIG